MGTVKWDADFAQVYDLAYAAMEDADVVQPIVDVLAELAEGGPVLEFAVGTGRIALPLAARGLTVHGIELSEHMAEQLRKQETADAVAITVGDMSRASAL